MTSAQRQSISSPSAGSQVFDTDAKVFMYYDGTRWLEIGADPIGTIKAWHKNFANTPALAWGWVECSGQILSDIDSPYNGQTIPNLNSATQDGSSNSGMFLRGGPTSGILQDDATSANGLSSAANLKLYNDNQGFEEISSGTSMKWSWGSGSIDTSISSSDSETRPANMSVVWIMRVK